ncbi:hypothetical protein FMUAM8_31660 [Nocardia cyriacigeorgica]|nr:hypothetical protein FMUAM8_31660 [Nocardia cyriacigeorgica]
MWKVGDPKRCLSGIRGVDKDSPPRGGGSLGRDEEAVRIGRHDQARGPQTLVTHRAAVGIVREQKAR